MDVFFYKDIANGINLLPKDESHHITHVMRRHVGDVVNVANGCGELYEARIISVGTICTIDAKQVQKYVNDKKFRLHLAVAPTKMMERYEWMVDKCVEIGVDEITPILCQHSERKIIKVERLNNIAIAAMKQSKNMFLPQINEMLDFDDFVKNNEDDAKFMAYCDNGNNHLFNNIDTTTKKITVLIGPEGDFSNEEVDLAIAHGFEIISLGHNILRVETAAVAVAEIVAIKNFIS